MGDFRTTRQGSNLIIVENHHHSRRAGGSTISMTSPFPVRYNHATSTLQLPKRNESPQLTPISPQRIVAYLPSPMRLEAQNVFKGPLIRLPQHASPVVHVSRPLTRLVSGVKPPACIAFQAGFKLRDRLRYIIRKLQASSHPSTECYHKLDPITSIKRLMMQGICQKPTVYRMEIHSRHMHHVPPCSILPSRRYIILCHVSFIPDTILKLATGEAFRQTWRVRQDPPLQIIRCRGITYTTKANQMPKARLVPQNKPTSL